MINNPIIMGIINANEDSFFKSSRFVSYDAIVKIKQMIQDGVSIIDIGAVSSAPGADEVSNIEELSRIKPICDLIKQKKLYEKVDFSIDSYSPTTIEYALKSGFSIINDITGLGDDEVVKLAVQYNATVIIMHMNGTPKTMQQNPIYDDVVVEVGDFFENRIQKAKDAGIKKIVLDPGIGFGKNLEHNISLINSISHFKSFGYEVLIGASRKSMINMITPCSPDERLAGSIVIHMKALQNGADIIRVHDVKEHVQACRVLDALC